jgi:hypothetical protein
MRNEFQDHVAYTFMMYWKENQDKRSTKILINKLNWNFLKRVVIYIKFS